MSATELETAKPSSAKRKANVQEIEVDLQAPEPPSKKARRALKKGKPLPTKPSSNNDDPDSDSDDSPTGKDTKDSNNTKARSEHGVWIGNLPFRLTAADLRRWLVDSAGGVITASSITRVKLPIVKDATRPKTDKPANKGFAYVDFSDLATKVAAIALSEADLQGRKLLIKDATSFEGRPAKKEDGAKDGAAAADKTTPQQQAQSNASRKVFVGNLSFKTTREDLERNFEKCGEIEWAKLATFEDTGKCKGFGWVKFKEPEAAAWAVKGFVKVKEAVETEADFREDDSGGEEDDTTKDAGKGGQQQKQFKTRKWWVNRLLGRELKLELAEDDQLRYKKRFGKDAKRAAAPEGGEAKPASRGTGERRRTEPAVEMKASSQDLNVARLTGALVQHTGTKVTFD